MHFCEKRKYLRKNYLVYNSVSFLIKLLNNLNPYTRNHP